MASKRPKNFPLKRIQWIACLLFVAIIAGTWIVNFLVNFDLNDYRETVEQELSSLLSIPVQIDGMKFKFHHTNLALHLRDVQLGDELSAVAVVAPDMLLDLKWRGLLARDIEFSRVTLSRPEIWIQQLEGPIGDFENLAQEKRTPFIMDLGVFYNTKIASLTVNDGSVSFGSMVSQDSWAHFGGIEGEIKDIELNKTSPLIIKGLFSGPRQKTPTGWDLEGAVSFVLSEERGLSFESDLSLNAQSIDLDSLNELFKKQLNNIKISGTCDLSLNLQGATGDPLDFSAKVTSDRVEIETDFNEPQQVHFKQIVTSGHLVKGQDQNIINNLFLKIDDSQFAGDLVWHSSQNPFYLKASLVNSHLSMRHIKQWLPKTPGDWAKVRKSLRNQGLLQIESTELVIQEDLPKSGYWQLTALKGEFQNIGLAPDGAPEIKITSLPFELSKDQWQINNSDVQMGALQFTFSGHGHYNKHQFEIATIDFHGNMVPENFFNDWSIPDYSFASYGEVALSGQANGSLHQMILDLNIDLSKLRLEHETGLKFFPEKGDKLAINATLSPQKIKIDHSSFRWANFKGYFNGHYLIGTPESLELYAMLTSEDLSKLENTVPGIEKFQLTGQAELSFVQKGQFENSFPETTVTLRNVGFVATSHIAALKNINGRVKLSRNGLLTEGLQVSLGDSPVTVDAWLEDFENPDLILDVYGNNVRAKDIIFYSEEALFEDIHGHLVINKNQLLFDPVTATLNEGTKANIKGEVSLQPPYDVTLDIVSDFANISKIINLWKGSRKARLPQEKSQESRSDAEQKKGHITINARIKKGDLFGMAFHNAKGVITPSKEQLVIHPLDFYVGPGYCNSQVVTTFLTDGPTQIKISGHAENVDAFLVYHELLDRRSIVRGSLRGDFYLFGDTGENFLASSYGNMKIEIKDGVLHKFPVLSKVFSLLNVSQIFAFQLPDMDSEGMPFNKITANLHLDKGVLSTQDLTIKSEAMNQAYNGQMNLITEEVDLSMAIHPLGTVDKILSRIPLAGWLLTGEDQALVTAQFTVSGKVGDLNVQAMPLNILTEPTIGLLRRTLGLPFKLFEDPQILWGGEVKQE